MRVCLILLLLLQIADGEQRWTEFRGSSGNGIAQVGAAPLSWSENSNIRWKTEIDGEGWSSPVTDGKQIWITTAIVEKLTADEQERIRKERFADHMVGGALVIVGSVEFYAVGLDAESGEILHNVRLFDLDQPLPVHSLNSYASPTSVLTNGRLYCHFGSYGTVCLDTNDLKILWTAQLKHVESVGPGSSPIVHDGKFFVPCDGTDRQFVVALDADSGEKVWETNRPAMEGDETEYHKSFCTPILIEHEGRVELVVPGAQWIAAYDPATGAELWRLRHGRGFSCAVRPVYEHGLVYFTTGFMDSALLAVEPGGDGDVTDSHLKWRYEGQLPTMPSPVLAGDYIYLVNDAGIAECIHALTGEPIWKERLGGNFSASPILAKGNLYFCNREGMTTLVAASPEFRELGKNQLEGAIMASPAMIETDLLLRTESAVYRIQR